MPGKLLITGFTPFPGMEMNPSGPFASSLGHAMRTRGLLCLDALIDTSYEACEKKMEGLLEELAISDSPDSAILCLGVAGQSRCLRLERFALNIDDCPLSDNQGRTRAGVPIDPQGPQAFRTVAPVEEIADEIKALGIPVEISNSCGTYVCNHLYYWTMKTLNSLNSEVPVLFLHIPSYRDDSDTENPELNFQDSLTREQLSISWSRLISGLADTLAGKLYQKSPR